MQRTCGQFTMLKLLIDRWTDTDSRWSIAFSRARARCPYCRHADLRSTKHIGPTRNGEATEVTRKNALPAVETGPCACGRLVSMPNTFLQRWPYGTNVCRYNWHSAGSPGWPLPMLKCSLNIFFQIKYTEAALSNNTRKLLWFEITRMRIAVQKNQFIESFRHIEQRPRRPLSSRVHGTRASPPFLDPSSMDPLSVPAWDSAPELHVPFPTFWVGQCGWVAAAAAAAAVAATMPCYYRRSVHPSESASAPAPAIKTVAMATRCRKHGAEVCRCVGVGVGVGGGHRAA